MIAHIAVGWVLGLVSLTGGSFVKSPSLTSEITGLSTYRDNTINDICWLWMGIIALGIKDLVINRNGYAANIGIIIRGICAGCILASIGWVLVALGLTVEWLNKKQENQALKSSF